MFARTARCLGALAALLGLLGCAAISTNSRLDRPDVIARLQQLLPADAILLGEQHDAPDHQRIHLDVVDAVASQHRLAALVLEMAEQGRNTERLKPDAGEDAVRAALQWNNTAWPWLAYGPAVMAAVRAGVPVLGANLPAPRLREVMADTSFDMRLAGPALKAQQQLIRQGHCEMLPESQIGPMTRVQIARDVAMAQTVATATRPGKIVVLLAGSGHVDRSLGVPQHLPPSITVKAVLLHAEQASSPLHNAAQFDQVWLAQPAPAVDYCARFTATPLAPITSIAPLTPR